MSVKIASSLPAFLFILTSFLLMQSSQVLSQEGARGVEVEKKSPQTVLKELYGNSWALVVGINQYPKGGRAVDGGQAQKSLEGRHRGAAPVEAEGELVEVDLQVLLADAVIGAPQPGLEVSEDPMHTVQDLRRPLWGPLGLRSVAVAHRSGV